MKLVETLPERYTRKYPKPPKPGYVRKSALKYVSKSQKKHRKKVTRTRNCVFQ